MIFFIIDIYTKLCINIKSNFPGSTLIMDYKNYFSSIVSGGFVGAIFHPLDSLYYNYIVNNHKPNLFRKGFCFSTTTNIIKVCSIFPTQEFIKQKLHWMNSYWQDSISGMMTGTVVAFIATPINSIKVPLLTTNKNTIIIVNQIYNKDGLKGFNKGISLTICRDTFGYGTYFCLFPIINKYINNQPISSTIASIIALIIAYPFDVARTMRQDNTQNNSMKICLKNSFSGINQNRTTFIIFMVRMILSIPIGHCTYLQTQKFIEKNFI